MSSTRRNLFKAALGGLCGLACGVVKGRERRRIPDVLLERSRYETADTFREYPWNHWVFRTAQELLRAGVRDGMKGISFEYGEVPVGLVDETDVTGRPYPPIPKDWLPTETCTLVQLHLNAPAISGAAESLYDIGYGQGVHLKEAVREFWQSHEGCDVRVEFVNNWILPYVWRVYEEGYLAHVDYSWAWSVTEGKPLPVREGKGLGGSMAYLMPQGWTVSTDLRSDDQLSVGNSRGDQAFLQDGMHITI